jgi:uncharacterized protein YkwD
MLKITDVTGCKSRVIEDINNVRKQHNLKELKLSAILDIPAQSHSESMAINDFFGHYDPYNKTYAQNRVLNAGYNYRETRGTFREIIIAGFSVEYFVSNWMRSYSHKKAILHPDVKEIGIGYFYYPKDTGKENWFNYCTAILGVR